MYEIKNFSGGLMDVSKRRVKVAVSEMGSKDYDNEIIEKGAYTKTVAERGPTGANLIYHLADHRAELRSVIGKPMEIGIDGNKLYFVTEIPETSMGNEALKMYEAGLINQHSVGFSTVKDQKPKKEGDPRVLVEVKLYEASAVLWGANPNTPTMSVGKSIEENTKEADLIIEELKVIRKAIKGKFVDETCELLEIRLKMLEQKLRNIFNELTTPAASALEPVNERDFANALHLLTFSI